MRCRSVKRRPEVNKWDAEKIRNIVASPRIPNPEDPSRPDFDIDETRLPSLAVLAEDVGSAQGRLVSELLRRDFGITKRMLERYDYTAECLGCNAALSNKPRREHNKECRERIEAQMHEDPEDLVRIIERDIRLERPNRGDERSPEEGSPDSFEEGQPLDHAEQPADQQGADTRESDAEDHVLYGPEGDPRTAHTPSSSSGTPRGGDFWVWMKTSGTS